MNHLSPLFLAAASKMDTWSLISKASGVVIGVMVLLGLMSLLGWVIIGYKFMYLVRAGTQSEN